MEGDVEKQNLLSGRGGPENRNRHRNDRDQHNRDAEQRPNLLIRFLIHEAGKRAAETEKTHKNAGHGDQ